MWLIDSYVSELSREGKAQRRTFGIGGGGGMGLRRDFLYVSDENHQSRDWYRNMDAGSAVFKNSKSLYIMA